MSKNTITAGFKWPNVTNGSYAQQSVI